MGFGKTVWATVTAGVILIFIGWGLESIRDDLPTWLGIAVDFAWAPVAVPRAVAWITAFAIGFLIFDFWFTSRAKKKQDAAKATSSAVPPTLAARSRAAREMTSVTINALDLAADEESVLASLTQFGDSADSKKLLQKTKLTEFRFEHAVGSLNKKFMTSEFSGYGGRTISFKQAGREYAAAKDLDKRV